MYSDIDLQWTVAVAEFGDACRALATHLTWVGEVEALRTDPLTGVHPTQRLIFFRVAGLPLFWWVDLGILSADHDPEAVHPPGSFQSSDNVVGHAQRADVRRGRDQSVPAAPSR